MRRQRAIFISAGVPDPLRKGEEEYAKTADVFAIRDSITALVTVFGPCCEIVFGGHPAITPMVARIAGALGLQENILVYQSLLFEADFPPELKLLPRVQYVPAYSDRAASLAEMRRRMLHDRGFHAAFFIGGMKGVEDEFETVGTLPGSPIRLPLVTTGGAARKLAREYGEALRLKEYPGVLTSFDYTVVFRGLVRRWGWDDGESV